MLISNERQQNKTARQNSVRAKSKNQVLYILDKLGGYQLVHQKCGIIVKITPKKFAHVPDLAEWCNQCCRNLKMNQYVLTKVQSTRFSKKLHNQLAKLPKTNRGSIYNWI